MAQAVHALDAYLSTLLGDWSVFSTALAITLALLILYPIVYPAEPDTHPLLLARQAAINPVRRRGESAIYRSPEVPPGTPLRSGLNVKEAGAPRWRAGRDGDLRDVWREVLRAGSRVEGAPAGDFEKKGGEAAVVPRGKILTVLGKEEVVEHEVGDLTREIKILGGHMRERGVEKVAIYLPNGVEYLLAVFACSFYNITPILLPYNLPHPQVYEVINTTGANGLISAAGNLPLDDIAEQCTQLRLLTWVVEKTSRHMDWNGVPDSAADHLTVSVWHDVVEENTPKTTPDLPDETSPAPPPLLTISLPTPTSKPIITTYTHANLVSALGALITAVPLRQRLNPSDLLLPAHSLHIPYVFLQTLAALYTHASLALTSVAAPGVDLKLATRGVAPTVVVTSPESAAALLPRAENFGGGGPGSRLGRYFDFRALAEGRMPAALEAMNAFFLIFLAPDISTLGNAPGRLRLLLIPHLLGSEDSMRLTPGVMAELRILTRARVCYALVADGVAGAVAQTNVFDYRVGEGDGHFGVPLSSVEVKVCDSDDGKVASSTPEGQIVVSGPAVSGSEVRLGPGWFGVDGCLSVQGMP